MPAFRPPSLPRPTRTAARALSAALLLAMLAQPASAAARAAPLDPPGAALPIRQAPAAPQGGPCTTVVTTTVDSGYGSLRDAVACAPSGGAVTFSGLPVSSTITLTTGEIAFTKTLTIDGSGAPGLAVDGNTTSRIFHIGSSSPVTLTALVLQHGSASGNGGAVLAGDGPLALNQVTVLSNTSTGEGGGLYALGAVAVTGGQFEGNACTFGGCLGGGLSAGSATLSGVAFISNTSGDHGGGLFAYAAVTATNSLFERNTCLASNCRGGGVFATTSLSLTSTSFLTNTSLSHGGGAHAASAATLSGGRFQGNACTANFCDGGGLYAGLTLTLSGTEFISNTSRGGGGGAWTLDAGLVGGRFERNACLATCDDSGGGLYAPTLVLAGTEFISNTSSGLGGGAWAFVAAVSAGRFQGNVCVGADCQGGGLYTASTLALTDTEFISNTSLSRGGGAVAGTSALVSGGRFQGNACTQAGCWGGGLYVASTLWLTGTELISNTSLANGGGLWVGSPARLTGGRFERNACTAAACQGGGLWADTPTLTDTEFISNTSLGFGGGAYGWGATRVTGGRFQGNTSGSGGGLHAEGTLTLTGTPFLSNTSTSTGGGGVYAHQAASLSGAAFQGNTCTHPDCRGGGLFANSSASVTGSTFSGNQAAGQGGGVAANVLGPHTLVNVTLSGNTASVGGGGLYLGGTSSVRLLNVSVVSNTAPSGGGLLAEAGATVGVTNTLLAGNGASTCAGPIAFGTHNLEWPGTTCATAGPGAGFSTGDPLLDVLALNAPGLTWTHALLDNSPARDTGHAATCAGPLVNNLDQRGVTRPIDGDSIPGAVCDLGAYEAEAAVWFLYLPLVSR